MRKRLTAVGVAIAMLATLAACSGGGTTETTSGESSSSTEAPGTTDAAGGQTIKVGIALPLTGPSSTNAADLIQYAEYGLEDAAAELAEIGINLEWVLEDTVATAETGVAALNRLANVEQTPIVLTAYSAVVNAMAPLAEDLGVALVNIGAQSPTLAGLSPNLVNFYPLADVQVVEMAEYLRSATDVETAGVIYIDSEAGIAPAESFRDAFEEAGGEVVAMEPIEPDAPDASIPVARLLAESPDVIWVQTLVAEAPPVFQAIRDSDPDVLVATHGGLAEDVSVREAAGANLVGVIYSTLVSELPPGTEDVMDRFREDLGREPGFPSFIPYYYDFGFLVQDVGARLASDGTEVTGSSFLASLRDEPTVNTPLLGATTFREDLTVGSPVAIREIEDSSASPTDDVLIREAE